MASASSPLLLKGGRVIDPANKLDGPADILVEKGRVRSVTKKGFHFITLPSLNRDFPKMPSIGQSWNSPAAAIVKLTRVNTNLE